ncbi:hypothetical protein B7P43_G07268 [Cryptotermes secundus]|uniref:ADAMTS/ADAMTS-like cysteine-rich domain-containing protein n=1 Tax=Cryptotermes secundus TaxID=105785 RepID=A0A2J7QMX0_9NEOP|nr:hypothetical protein B7P43_G07268 [Cryptotermes secundus]
MGTKRNAYRTLVRNPEGRRPLGRPRRRGNQYRNSTCIVSNYKKVPKEGDARDVETKGSNLNWGRVIAQAPCPESGDFREQQCAAYNDVPYEGALLLWTAHHDDSEPCALTCRGRPAGEPLTQEEPIVVQLAPKVQDGTRCRPGSLDMCINGKCQRVGCDLKIGSMKKVDGCGVCGGDGLSCAQPLYHWEEAAMSLCSVTCGGGYKMSRPVCINRVTGAEVDEPLCNASQRPERKVVECNSHRCPAKWVVDDWGPCSVTCAGGSRFRHVHCAEEGNGTRSKRGIARYVRSCGKRGFQKGGLMGKKINAGKQAALLMESDMQRRAVGEVGDGVSRVLNGVDPLLC